LQDIVLSLITLC